MRRFIKDRVSQLRGNRPYLLPTFSPRVENPLGIGGFGDLKELEAYNLIQQASEAEKTYFRDRVVFQRLVLGAGYVPANIINRNAPHSGVDNHP